MTSKQLIFLNETLADNNSLTIRPKKVVLFPEIGHVKIFLSPTRPHKSNVYENIYFLFQKNTHTNKTNLH